MPLVPSADGLAPLWVQSYKLYRKETMLMKVRSKSYILNPRSPFNALIKGKDGEGHTSLFLSVYPAKTEK